jgi:hypothetical protein
MRSFVALFLVAAGLVVASSGAAAPAGRQTLERAAKKACLAGNPRQGVEILAELYINSNNDITYIFNQGRCFEQNSLYEEAIGRFREYLLKGEDRLSDSERATAQKHIDTCESYLPLEKRPVRPAPVAPEPVHVPPVAETRPAQAPSDVPSVAAVHQLSPLSNGESGSGLRIAGVVAGTVGAVALLSGVILNLKVNSMSSDLEKPDSFNRDTDSTRSTYKTLALSSYGVGAACLAGGSLLYYWGWRTGRDSAPSVALIADLGPHVAGALLRGAF